MQTATRRTVRGLAAFVVAVVMSWAPSPIAAADPGVSSATFVGRAGCLDPVLFGAAGPCKEWNHRSPEGARDWSKAESMSVSGSFSMTAKGNVSFVETFDAQGAFKSVTINVHVEASVSGGGLADSDFLYGRLIVPATTALDVTGILSANDTGTEFVGSFSRAEITLNCGDDEFETQAEARAGAGNGNAGSDSKPLGLTVASDEGDCSLQVSARANSATNRPAPGQSGRASADVSVTVTASGAAPPCEGLHGTVLDGKAPVAHHNPLPGVRVELFRNGAATGRQAVTADDGTYCIPPGEGADPGDYTVRVTLVDARHEPPLFTTRVYGMSGPAFVDQHVSAGDFGIERVTDIAFVDDAANPHLSDTANIHWQSTRFVDWVLSMGITPQTFGQVDILTFNDSSTSSQYAPVSPPTVSIAAAPAGGAGPGKSTFAARDGARDNGPENAEWHELGHHLVRSMGVADFGPACQDVVNHGGWINATTCDSLNEGFAMFIATLASLTLDADRGPDYATPYYANFFDLEVGGYRPWMLVGNGPIGREDFAVAQLLWDLVDDTPDEAGLGIRAWDPISSEALEVAAHDRIAIPGKTLLQILQERRPQTVVELFDALRVDPALPASATVRDLDLDGNLTEDVSPLEEVFLVHGFHPVHGTDAPRFYLGDAVGRTDRALPPSQAVQSRPSIEHLANSYVRLRNGTDAETTFGIEVAFPGGKVSRTVVLPAHSTGDEYVELPPFYQGVLAPDAPMPECGGANQEPLPITIRAVGSDAQPLTLDSCAYWHAIESSTDGTAVTYSVGSGPFGADPGASADPQTGPVTGPLDGAGGGIPTVVLVAAAALAIALALVVALAAARTRRQRA